MGRKICICTEENHASIGIGSMIVFVAMVLVAGIAASVLIQTSVNLEMQALRTGQQTTEEAASGLHVESVEGNASTTSMTKVAVHIRPRAGTPDVDLNQTVIEIADSSTKYLLRHSGNNATRNNSIDGAIFNVTNFGSATTFDIIILQDADNSVYESNVVNFGDHVILAIDSSAVFSGIAPRTDVSGLVIPEEGAPGIIGFTTPASYTSAEQIYELQ
jgi:flagellin FlaB